MMSDSAIRPALSVVIPSFNSEEYLGSCLKALRASDWDDMEIIVMDDASDDDSDSETARHHDARLIRLVQRSGPAVARNLGVEQARADIVLFIDADVMVQPNTISTMMETFRAKPGISALFGSYDDTPTDPTFFSQYRNLYHRWVHQQGSTEASTFWTGCGAIRKQAFLDVGGFNTMYTRPAMEDIELGYRLKKAGLRIQLCKDALCTHMKRWSFFSMVYVDIFRRGIPWVTLALHEKDGNRDLNLNAKARIATMAAALMWISLALATFFPIFLVLAALAAGIIVAMQWAFYRMVWKIRGAWFTLKVIPAQIVFFTCCAVSIPPGFAQYLVDRSKQNKKSNSV